MGRANHLFYFTIGRIESESRLPHRSQQALGAATRAALPPLAVAPPFTVARISREERRLRLWPALSAAREAGGLSSHKRFLAKRLELQQPQAWAAPSLLPPSVPQGPRVSSPSDAAQVRKPGARLL